MNDRYFIRGGLIMKQFFLKQRVFSLGNKYNVFDKEGNVCYYIEGKIFSIHNKMDIYQGEEIIYHLERKLFRFMPEYTLYSTQGEVLATIKKNFTFFGGKMTIDSTYGMMEIVGQVFQRDFQLFYQGKEVMNIHKQWLTWGDTYQITIMEDAKESFYVALALMIDVIFHESSGNSSSSHHHR
jgi:uncharacterized protein YxjI